MVLKGTILLGRAALGIEGIVLSQPAFFLFQCEDLGAQQGQILPQFGIEALSPGKLFPERDQGCAVYPAASAQFPPERRFGNAEGSVAEGHGASTSLREKSSLVWEDLHLIISEILVSRNPGSVRTDVLILWTNGQECAFRLSKLCKTHVEVTQSAAVFCGR